MSTTTDEHPPSDDPGRPPGAEGPRVSATEARDLTRMVRTAKDSPEGRHIAGVAGGIARHFDIDPAIVRVALVVLVFFGGAGLLLYGAGWLLLPDETDGRAVIGVDRRSRAFALYVAAGLSVLALLGDTVGSFDFPWPLAIIALILLVIFGTRDRVKAPDWQPYAAPPAPGQPVTGPVGQPVAQPGVQPGVQPGEPGQAGQPMAPPYGQPGPTGPSYTPPTAPPPAAGPAYVPTPDPRRRGPILFWFTLALIALLEGALGILDAAPGVSIPDPAYAALAVGVTGAMLVLGAFWGRAGGLILVGLVATFALVLSVAAQEYDGRGDHVHAIPLQAADLERSYDMDAGELKVDLTQISDLPALDGRRLDLSGGIGSIEVTVPDDLNVVFDGEVNGPGQLEFFGDGRGGISTSMDRTHVVAEDAPTLTIDAQLGVGQISVRSE